jgi:CBS domain-containing protein
MNLMQLGSVAAIMKTRLITATPYETVAVAVDRMVDNKLGALLVVENDRLVGIFSERDVLQRVVARRQNPETTLLSKVLTPNPSTVTEETPLETCLQLIEQRGFRHLPVINRYRNPIGVIYARDLLQHVLSMTAQLQPGRPPESQK